jgi:PAS domain S-box-containing protein
MSISNLSLNDLRNIFNYVSESIVISDKNHNIVLINEAAVKKLLLNYETIYTKTLLNYIPSDQVYKVENAIIQNDNDYYEIVLNRENGETFPALVSGKELTIENKIYRISTILDVTELKEKEDELLLKSKSQIKKLKTHIISNVTEKSKELNKIKNLSEKEIKSLNHHVEEYKHKNNILLKQVMQLKKENINLTNEVDKLQKNGFNFKDILELEILKAKTYKLNFSLVKVVIDKFDELKSTIKTQNKLEMILTAIKRQFKSSIKNIDIAYHDTDEIYYLILSNSSDTNITNIVEKLTIPKKMDGTIDISFSYGISYFFEKDDVKGMIYRCNKNLEENVKK